ncbi:MBL fold metallo-hydrolase [Kribbella sp. NPDC051770]|uniref:MBL fold metallo-hydrolase n=1 Tax=Kribbella sp. NPDC051770 TaxID=3155413 RepID=UPI003436898B
MSDNRVVEAAENVFLVRGSAVNWILLRDGTDLTLVDSGYPGDLNDVEESIRSIGRRPEDVQAILVTHAHVDHLGAVNPFHTRYGTPAYFDPTEVAHAHRDYLEQLAPPTLLKNIWRPRVLPWAVHILRNGATQDVAAPHAQAFPGAGAGAAGAAAGALDLPGAPVPVPTHGHTSGHTAFHLPAVGAVITGDALVTGHPLSPTTGPQLLPAMFAHASRAELLSALTPLEALDADLLLPGHGPLHHGPIADAVVTARS